MRVALSDPLLLYLSCHRLCGGGADIGNNLIEDSEMVNSEFCQDTSCKEANQVCPVCRGGPVDPHLPQEARFCEFRLGVLATFCV